MRGCFAFAMLGEKLFKIFMKACFSVCDQATKAQGRILWMISNANDFRASNRLLFY